MAAPADGGEPGQLEHHVVDAGRQQRDAIACRPHGDCAVTSSRCSAGPVTVTVTPGSTAPLASLMVPAIAPVTCAVGGRREGDARSKQDGQGGGRAGRVSTEHTDLARRPTVGVPNEFVLQERCKVVKPPDVNYDAGRSLHGTQRSSRTRATGRRAAGRPSPPATVSSPSVRPRGSSASAPSTLRLWENVGLVSPVRSNGRYRLYSPDLLKVLKRIKYLRDVQTPERARHQARAGARRDAVEVRVGQRPLGPVLRRLRQRRGMGLVEAAGAGRDLRGFLSSLERSQANASVATLQRLATTYGDDRDGAVPRTGARPAVW